MMGERRGRNGRYNFLKNTQFFAYAFGRAINHLGKFVLLRYSLTSEQGRFSFFRSGRGTDAL